MFGQLQVAASVVPVSVRCLRALCYSALNWQDERGGRQSNGEEEESLQTLSSMTVSVRERERLFLWYLIKP